MAAPFVVEGATPGTQVWSVDASGNTVQAGTMSVTGATSFTGAATVGGTLTENGITVQNAGINSSGSVHYIATLGFGVSAATGTQLSDTTRDYMVYLTTSAGGAGATVLIGPTSACTNTVSASGSVGTGVCISYKLPAGWYTMWTTSVAVGQQNAISC
jgi:hypothetical protein